MATTRTTTARGHSRRQAGGIVTCSCNRDHLHEMRLLPPRPVVRAELVASTRAGDARRPSSLPPPPAVVGLRQNGAAGSSVASQGQPGGRAGTMSTVTAPKPRFLPQPDDDAAGGGGGTSQLTASAAAAGAPWGSLLGSGSGGSGQRRPPNRAAQELWQLRQRFSDSTVRRPHPERAHVRSWIMGRWGWGWVRLGRTRGGRKSKGRNGAVAVSAAVAVEPSRGTGSRGLVPACVGRQGS